MSMLLNIWPSSNICMAKLKSLEEQKYPCLMHEIEGMVTVNEEEIKTNQSQNYNQAIGCLQKLLPCNMQLEVKDSFVAGYEI